MRTLSKKLTTCYFTKANIDVANFNRADVEDELT